MAQPVCSGLGPICQQARVKDQQIANARLIRDNWKAQEENHSKAVNSLVEAKQKMEQAQKEVDTADKLIRVAFENRKGARHEADVVVEDIIQQVRQISFDPGAADEFLQFIGASILETRASVAPLPAKLDGLAVETRPNGVNLISWKESASADGTVFVLQFLKGVFIAVTHCFQRNGPRITRS